ncbi:site-specific integrase [Nocardia abscessus]|uniref:site-specific integrase n=1 Tax=Nocardia abscessus TaxID=120957 RepID=UPI001894F23D|nr:site-specific integrase [Nocardia abscessus]MBF6223360.1 site-specific integrase [Nocardia abscessus]
MDALILRLLIETACRRGGLLGLYIEDLNVSDCLVRLHEKGGTVRPANGKPRQPSNHEVT